LARSPIINNLAKITLVKNTTMAGKKYARTKSSSVCFGAIKILYKDRGVATSTYIGKSFELSFFGEFKREFVGISRVAA